MVTVHITPEKFEAYEDLRLSGAINMLDVVNGSRLTGLTRDEYTEIIRNYSEYWKQFNQK